MYRGKTLEVLRLGFITLVTMEDGRQLAFFDASKLQQKGISARFGARERLAYYFVTSIVNDRSRSDGLNIVILVSVIGLANNE